VLRRSSVVLAWEMKREGVEVPDGVLDDMLEVGERVLVESNMGWW